MLPRNFATFAALVSGLGLGISVAGAQTVVCVNDEPTFQLIRRPYRQEEPALRRSFPTSGGIASLYCQLFRRRCRSARR